MIIYKPIAIIKCIPHAISSSRVSGKITECCSWSKIITNQTSRVGYKLDVPYHTTYSISCHVILKECNKQCHHFVTLNVIYSL